MSRWFRVYDDLVDDPKVQLLGSDSFRALINLWCLASQNGGALPSIESITFKLRMKFEKVERIVLELEKAGLLDRGVTGLRPHNWDSRQFKSDVSNERVKRHRKRQCNVTSAVTATPPDTDTDTDTDTKRKDAANAAPELPLPDAEVDLFRRGKVVLGNTSGGLIKQLLAAKEGKVPLARAAIETAATKQNPREYIGAIVRGRDPSNYVDPRL